MSCDRRVQALRSSVLVGILVLAAGLIACNEDTDADLSIEILEVTVSEGGLNPETHQVRLPDRYQLVVTNETDEMCAFFFGPFVNALDVSANGSAQIDFQTPPDLADDPDQRMGCEGQPERMGRVEILTSTALDP